MWKRLAGRPTGDARLVQAQVLFFLGSIFTDQDPITRPDPAILRCRTVLTSIQAQVHPPARAVRSRPFVSAGPFCRGSFALGTGRSPMSRPHARCVWKRLPVDPRVARGQVHPPAGALRRRTARDWTVHSRLFALRTGASDEKPDCAMRAEPPRGSALASGNVLSQAG